MEFALKTEGLRSIKKMPFIELQPVTLLVGLNNSGKSTFLRSLPLLKQSLNSNIDSPIVWNENNLVDFGSFSSAVSQKLGKSQEEITFCFKVSDFSLMDLDNSKLDFHSFDFIVMLSRIFPEFENVLGPFEVIYSFTVKNFRDKDERNFTVFKQITISVGNMKYEFIVSFSEDGSTIKKLSLNGEELSGLLKWKYIEVSENSVFFEDFILVMERDKSNFDRRFLDFRGTDSKGNRQDYLAVSLSGIMKEFLSMVKYGSSEDYLDIFPKLKGNSNIMKQMSNCFKGVVGNQKNLNDCVNAFMNESEKEILLVKNYAKLFLLSMVHDNLGKVLRNFMSELSYLKPTRVIGERSYPFVEYHTSQLDSDGRNLPHFLTSLSNGQFKDFSNWIEKIFGFGLKINEFDAHWSVDIEFKRNSMNVIDTGIGISQILPALAQMWWAIRKPLPSRGYDPNLNFVPRTILMEQPELHLHPVQQANLADAIVNCVVSKENSKPQFPRFIIETHSEKLVSRFGRLIREGKIAPSNIQVVMFDVKNVENPIETSVEICPFNENGTLENWHYGFFNSG